MSFLLTVYLLAVVTEVVTPSTMTAAGCKELALVRWLEDETVAIMLLSAVVKGQTPSVGGTIKMRWRGKKEYEAQILKISRMYTYIAVWLTT